MSSRLITSTANAWVKQIAMLQNKKSSRKQEGYFVIEGLRGVKELPETAQIREYIISEEVANESLPLRAGVPITIVSEEVYKHLSDTKTPQGVMAVVKMCDVTLETLIPNKNAFYLVLENVQDPGNLGTILRTAYGFGVDAVLMTKGCVDLYNPKTIRSTMSALLNLPIVIDLETEVICEWMTAQNITLYVTDLQESRPVHEYDFGTATAVAIGNEANGISEALRQGSHKKMIIPMPGGLESLNAAVAASICMYEVMRQRL